MRYESIKSFILVILVLTSILLTWNLWTYQPNYEVLKKNTDIVQEVALSAKKDIKDLVKADKMIFHIEDHYYGTVSDQEVEKVINEMSRWNFSDFEDISSQVGDISSLEGRNEVVQILYPGLIPMNLYKNIFTIKDKNYPNFSFDEIMINTEINQRENGVVYFISRDEQQIYKGIVPASTIMNFKEKYFSQAEQYTKYFPFKTALERTIFLPETETKLDAYQYLSKPLDSNKFRNALFNDPSLVQKNYISTGEEFTDGSSLMRVNNDLNMIDYVDPSEVVNKANSYDLLKKSIDFVNEHGGWTDNYRFVGIDNDPNTSLFRLYGKNGYPVFGENSYPVFGENSSISEIRLVWGKTDISRYVRSNFSLGLLTTTRETTLPSGLDIIHSIQQLDHYNPALLEDVTIGYEMKKDAQSLLVYLEPSWYYFYNGQWRQWTSEVLGGEKLGLE